MNDLECNLENITIHYETHGSGQPLVALHGLGPDRRLMIGCIEPIFTHRDGWQRIYPDLPGMGRTPVAEGISNSDDVLEVFLDYIHAIIPDQEFTLAGESYGCQLARALLHRIPNQVNGLLLICPGLVENRTLPLHSVVSRDQIFMATLKDENKPLFESFAVVQNEHTWKRTNEEVIPGIMAASKEFVSQLRTEGYPFSFDLEQLSQPFQKPTLVLSGRQDSMSGYRDVWEFLENFPRATFAILDKAGHNLQIEQEILFNALVNEWLDRVEERSLV
jgi:pimeloyl-ACP methyl ester carboxylesterase